MAESPDEEESRPLSATEWREDAAIFRRYADHARQLIALGDRRGAASQLNWAASKAALLDLAASWDRMAEEAEAKARDNGAT
jgi:hypothetical protein